MLRAVFVEDRIGIVDMDQNFASLDVLGVLLEHSAGSGERHVTDLASGLLAAPGFNQFIIAPESSVDKGRVAIFDPGTPGTCVPVSRFCASQNCGSIKYFLVAFMNHECCRRFFGEECAPHSFPYVIR